MAKIYISSTFRDLEAYRQAVYRQLTRMQHGVMAMEDYVARDDRPADACTRDVTNSDLYVGLSAWRYGYVPKDATAQGIAEMQSPVALSKAVVRKRCHVFPGGGSGNRGSLRSREAYQLDHHLLDVQRRRDERLE